MSKRATRWSEEIVDADEHQVWEMLASSHPPVGVVLALRLSGLTIRRVTKPDRSDELPLVYSHADPWASVEAAMEHADRRPTQMTRALALLVRNEGQWVEHEAIIKVGGAEGARRVRELRSRGWPLETCQLAPGESWAWRLVMPDHGRIDLSA